MICIGGRAPEYLRNDARVIRLVQEFNVQGKYIFAICHGIQILVTAGLVENKNITCYEHVKFEVTSCGGTYIKDQEAVQDGRSLPVRPGNHTLIFIGWSCKVSHKIILFTIAHTSGPASLPNF